jgi:hypothetical protein
MYHASQPLAPEAATSGFYFAKAVRRTSPLEQLLLNGAGLEMNPFYAVALLAILMIWFGIVVWRERQKQVDPTNSAVFPALAAITTATQSDHSMSSAFFRRISLVRW